MSKKEKVRIRIDYKNLRFCDAKIDPDDIDYTITEFKKKLR